jgi:hypothetical protein
MRTTNRKPKVQVFVQYDRVGNRHVFNTREEAEQFAMWHKRHTEERRASDEKMGSLAALVCNSSWRMARER